MKNTLRTPARLDSLAGDGGFGRYAGRSRKRSLTFGFIKLNRYGTFAVAYELGLFSRDEGCCHAAQGRPNWEKSLDGVDRRPVGRRALCWPVQPLAANDRLWHEGTISHALFE